MGKQHLVLASLYFAFAGLCLGVQPMNSNEKRQLEREARLVVDLMQNYHESGRLFRELDNHEILTRFMAELDPDQCFFTKDDGDFVQMRFGRSLKSVYLLKGDLQPAFEIFDLFSQRVKARTDWIENRIPRGFVFDTADALSLETEPTAPANAAAADDRWERKLKDEVLSEIIRGRTEADAFAAVAKRYAKLRRHIDTLDSLAIRERFFDGLLQAFDPHSGYFSADSTREFNLEMTGAVAGAGLELKKENGLCLVSLVQPGGPADLTTDLRPGDIVEAVAEGDAALTDVKGKRLREIVTLVRGKAGTKLRLACRHPDENQRFECQLERALVVNIEERARGAICQVPSATGKIHRIGWIDLPAFYAAHDDSTDSSATRDVSELLEQMRKTGIDGLVLDLRNNGGGALTEALALSGLFIPKGLVMLTRGLDGKVNEHYATESPNLYPGPFVVLTSARSASASEIFSGAMKFHHRALIVGSPATFGKGSVQNYIELAKTTRGSAEDQNSWGTLRLTSERFYQPDGKAVQRNGILADVVLPQEKTSSHEREETLPHALPAESIPAPAAAVPAAGLHSSVTPQLCDSFSQGTEENIKSMPEWLLWKNEQQLIDKVTEAKSRSLQLGLRQAEELEIDKQLAALRAQRRKLSSEAGFPTEPFEIAAVQTALDAHRARNASLKTSDGASILNHLEKGAFFFKTDKGFYRRLWLGQFDYVRFLGDTATLAEAFTAGSGLPMTSEKMRQALQSTAALEEYTESHVLDCFSKDTAQKTDPNTIRKGVEAILLRMTEIDGDLRRYRPALDVQLREGLRIAGGWADLLETQTGQTPSAN